MRPTAALSLVRAAAAAAQRDGLVLTHDAVRALLDLPPAALDITPTQGPVRIVDAHAASMARVERRFAEGM